MSAPDPNRLVFLSEPRSAGDDAAVAQTEHLLKVAASVAQDANGVWAEMWGQIKPHVSPSGAVAPEMNKGFVPACGWTEFLEKFWLLKHYLDSIDRLCRSKR